MADGYTLGAETGRLLWKKKVDDHAGARVTGSPVVHEGVIYVPVASGEETLARVTHTRAARFAEASSRCGSQDGSQVWKTYMIAEVPT